MRIAITMNVTVDPKHGERRDSLSHDWSNFIYRLLPAGCLFPVPNQPESLPGFLSALNPDCAILSNGNNWGDEPERDATEALLVDWCLAHDLPLLGACRGLQSLNAILGGEVASDLEAVSGIRHGGIQHRVKICQPEFSMLAEAEQLLVNSYHNQGVLLSGLASCLEAFALAEDGNTVEAFYHKSAKMLAMQWHPERASPSASFDAALILSLFSKGAFWK